MPKVLIHELDSTEKGTGSDMCLYFNTCYLKVAVGGINPQWASYHGCNNGDHHFKVGKGSGENLLVPHGDKKTYVEWYYPTGWFNVKKTAIFCERLPKRQWHRGIKPGSNWSCTSAESIAKDAHLLTPADPTDKSAQEVLDSIKSEGKLAAYNSGFFTEIFESPVFTTVEEAYIAVKSKKAFCRALSKSWALIPHPHTKDLLIFLHDFPVAEMMTKTKVHALEAPFKPECQAFFLEKGITVV